MPPRYPRQLERASAAAAAWREADAAAQLERVRQERIARRAAAHAAAAAAAHEAAMRRDADAGAQLAHAGLMAARMDAGTPPRPNPGAGSWAAPMPVAAPAPVPATATGRDGIPRDPFASLGMRPRAALAAEDRVRWSGDLERPTTDRWRGSVR